MNRRRIDVLERDFAVFLGVLLAIIVLTVAWARFFVPPKQPLTEMDVGTLVDIQPGETGWKASRVETTEGIYIVYGSVSGKKGAKVTIRSDGYLFVEGTPRGPRVSGFEPD